MQGLRMESFPLFYKQFFSEIKSSDFSPKSNSYGSIGWTDIFSDI
jgi:hypothetical protein